MTYFKDYVQAVTPIGFSEQTTRETAILTLGLCGESQEVFIATQDLQRRPSEAHRHELAGELGDVLYYWVKLCALFKLDPLAMWCAPRVAEGLVTLAPAVQLLVNAGKVAELCKKLIRDGARPETHLALAMVDLGHGWRACCKYHGLKESDILAGSLRKIETRKKPAGPSE